MSRRSTLGADWKPLLEAVGGIGALCESIGVSQSTFYRASRGLVELPPEKVEALDILCEIYGLANPLAKRRKPRAKDLSPLRMMGEAMAKGFPPAPRTIERLKNIFPEEQLIELANSNNTPESILRAVTVLLEA